VPAAPELRLSDLHTLLAVQRTGSISGAGRELRVTPSQVSKAIARLERYFAVRLLSRGARGVVPTAAGRQVLPRIANAVAELRATAAAGRGEVPLVELTIAGPSYLVAQVLPALVGLLPAVRMRGLDLVPAQLRAYVAENVFDVALAPGGVDNRPAAWSDDVVGTCRSALLARPAYAKRLGPLPLTQDRVRPLPFVGPARVNGERFAAVNDDCPLPWEKRWIAHEAQAVAAALEVVSRSDYVVFCPVLAASRFLASGEIVEVPVTGWDVRDPLHVLCSGDRVLSRVQQAIVRATVEALQRQAQAPLGEAGEASRGTHASTGSAALSS
jgi:DNA-binding transcriptional LysR family regulator